MANIDSLVLVHYQYVILFDASEHEIEVDIITWNITSGVPQHLIEDSEQADLRFTNLILPFIYQMKVDRGEDFILVLQDVAGFRMLLEKLICKNHGKWHGWTVCSYKGFAFIFNTSVWECDVSAITTMNCEAMLENASLHLQQPDKQNTNIVSLLFRHRQSDVRFELFNCHVNDDHGRHIFSILANYARIQNNCCPYIVYICCEYTMMQTSRTCLY